MQLKRLLTAASVPLLGALGAEQRGTSRLSPVTRVVELLKSLGEKTEEEAKTEEDLYESFVCWAKSIVSQKTASNTDAEGRSRELRTYIDDLDNGRIELTSERRDLTKQLDELNSDIESANRLRESEKKDFEVAKDEMENAADALTKAVEVLAAATGDHKKGSLLATRSQLDNSAASRTSEADALSRAVDLGSRVLLQADASFLRRVLIGEVPKANWKKLNRKATFKMDYKARSFKIQDVLAKLLQSFETDLKEANEKERAAVELFTKLMDAKGDEKGATELALEKMEKESGARGLSKDESQEELDALTEQIANDDKYIGQVKRSLEDKKLEWKDRQELRTGEQAAISKAIEILHSDDARDLMKRSLSSQDRGAGFLFLQEAAVSGRTASAVKVLRRAAEAGGDARLAVLARRVARTSQGHFEEVLSAIDKMLEALSSEEAADLAKKEQCEADRAKDTREAAQVSRAMDDLTSDIVAGKAKIQEITQEIQDKTAQIAATEEELRQATEMRQKEHGEWQVSDKDDKDAKVVVLGAKDVLEKFYADNGLMLMQAGAKRAAAAAAGHEPVESVAGEAPPPPPSTWEAPYGGKTDQSVGIISMLDMIAEDIEKDLKKAAAEEDASTALYETTKVAMETEVQELNSAITDLSGVRGGVEKEMNENHDDRLAKRGELDIVLKTIKDAAPNCDYFAANYPLRVSNRQTETDGLNKAKTILSGGKFAAPKDPNREMKPGDAFVQARLGKFLGRATVL